MRTGFKIGCCQTSLKSIAIMSACLPGSSDPVIVSIPSAGAVYVAIFRYHRLSGCVGKYLGKE